MKASRVAQVVATLLATDAKPSEASILAAILAADKKGKDEFPPTDKDAKDEFPPKDDKAKDEKDDPEHTNDADMDDMGAEDEDDDKKAKDDIQPMKSATGNSGAGGKEPAKDKKGMDTAKVVQVALDARDALHAARREVETVIGVVAYDSAADVYKAALTKLGVDTKGVHESAFATLFRMKRDAVTASAPIIASDSAAVTGMASRIKGYTRLP